MSTYPLASTTECIFIQQGITQTTFNAGGAVGMAEGVTGIVVGVVAGVLVYHCTRK